MHSTAQCQCHSEAQCQCNALYNPMSMYCTFDCEYLANDGRVNINIAFIWKDMHRLSLAIFIFDLSPFKWSNQGNAHFSCEYLISGDKYRNLTIAINIWQTLLLSTSAANASGVRTFVVIVDGGRTPSPVDWLASMPVEDAAGDGGRKTDVVESYKFLGVSEQGLRLSMAI